MTDPVQTPAEDWLPVGEEPSPTGSITHLTVLRSDEVSLLSLPNGEIDARTEPATGMYYHDTRYLSLLRLSFGGVEPVLLDSRETEHGVSATFCNPRLVTSRGETLPAQVLTVRRRRTLHGGLVESLALSNYAREELDTELRFDFGADFKDIFEVRGYQREGPHGETTVEVDSNEVSFRYDGADGIVRRTRLRFSITPRQLTANSAMFRFQLAPRETQSLEIEVAVGDSPPTHNYTVASNLIRRRQATWLADITSIQTDDEEINSVLRRALLDIEALHSSFEGERYIAAGVPWFDTLFGRDSLITGMELLGFQPEILKTSLGVLARSQADAHDPRKDAEPGKIPHELRWGEMANTGEIPFGRYYGSVDVTPLFIVAALEYLHWTGDIVFVRELWPHIGRAMEWCVSASARGPRGFLAYKRETAVGLENQGWKDSHDAIVWPNGELVEPPIALVEVQAYLGAAYSAYLRLSASLGQPITQEDLDRPARFYAAFRDAFEDPEVGYALCLDGQGRPVPTRASNAGHVLWMGLATRQQAELTANTLLSSDMFSGWGVRTLSSTVVGFNPLGYHVGSVWPHDNALFLDGLRWYGFDDEATELAEAMVQMALGFPEYRVPELFSGDAREFRPVPTPYPVASRPQAWSAASIPYLFISMLGIRPRQANQLSIMRPRLPLGLKEVFVRRLRLGGGRVDLTFRQLDGHVSVAVERIAGDIEVVLATNWPEEDALPPNTLASRLGAV